MAEPDETRVKEALTDFHGRIISVFERGWAEWRDIEGYRLSKGYKPMLYSRTSANYVFDAVARAAQDEFSADPRCRVFDEPQTLKVCFGDLVIGRFKKGDEDGLGQNIPTQAALDFTDPEQSLPGLPPEADKVEFTWSSNAIGTRLETILVVARNGDKAVWAYEIGRDEGAGVIEFPFDRPAAGPGTAGDELVAPKQKPEEGTGGER